MKVVLFISGIKMGASNQRLHFPLSVMAIATTLRVAIENVVIIDARIQSEKEWIERIKTEVQDATFFGVSCLTGPGIEDCIKGLEVSKKVNENIITVWGGYHATINYKELLEKKYCDLVIRGKGEIPWKDIISTFRKWSNNCENIIEKISECDNIYSLKNAYSKIMTELPNLDEYPCINYDLIDVPFYLSMTDGVIDFVTSYGCPGNCKFCVEPAMSTKWSGTSAEKVVKDVKYLFNEYKPKRISIIDPEFGGSSTRLAKIINELSECDMTIPISINLRVIDVLFLEKQGLISKLKSAGIIRIILGIESGSDSMLKKIGKAQTAEQAYHVCKILSSQGIETYCNFIHDFPDETQQEMEENLNFIKKIAGMPCLVQWHHFYTEFIGSGYYNEKITSDEIQWERINTRSAFSNSGQSINFMKRKMVMAELYKLSKLHPNNLPRNTLPKLINN